MARARRRSILRQVLLLIAVVAFIRWITGGGSLERSEETPEDEIEQVVRELGSQGSRGSRGSQGSQGSREGVAAVVLMDVSGSMADSVRDAAGRRPKIDVARRAAGAVIGQFASYARAHPGEPVLVGLFEFSERDDEPAARQIIPLSPSDEGRAATALAAMRADGGTPIGDAMIAANRALDASGLTRRHLLVVTDGENTDGYEPASVMAALGRRPESDRPSVYFVAFDVSASRFSGVRDHGGLVLTAANAQELNATLESLLTGKILVEGP